MEELSVARKRLKTAHDNQERYYNETISALGERESHLAKRLNELNRKKDEIFRANGTLDSADDDLVEINAGGIIIVAKRSTLTQMQGTRLEALFSGRWDKLLQRDSHGRIFIDVNPTCFQAIVDYLNEMMISSKDSPADPPSVNDEHKHILKHQLKLFGIFDCVKVEFPHSIIIKDDGHRNILLDWLKEDGSDGQLDLLYQGSRDGFSAMAFHHKCDDKGCTLTIIETSDGKVVGGYSNAPWSTLYSHSGANKAFLFGLSGSGLSPCKMKLKDVNNPKAIRNITSCGPVFGALGFDMGVMENGSKLGVNKNGSKLILNSGNNYHPWPDPWLPYCSFAVYTIKEIEVFQVIGSAHQARYTESKENAQDRLLQVEPVTRFSDEVNNAINENHTCLLHSEAEMLQLEESFNDERTFIEKFASGDAKDVVALNVSGTIMITTRATLSVAEDSVLAQQFDDSKWKEQGCNAPRVKEWTPDEVSTWAKSIDGLHEDVSIMLNENEITGRELLALSLDALKMMGMKRVGTVALLLKEIEKLEKASRDSVTLIEHSPYCFGKILDYLRLKQLHLSGLLAEEPALPNECGSQKNRFEKVVKYYFPGDTAKFILG